MKKIIKIIIIVLLLSAVLLVVILTNQKVNDKNSSSEELSINVIKNSLRNKLFEEFSIPVKSYEIIDTTGRGDLFFKRDLGRFRVEVNYSKTNIHHYYQATCTMNIYDNDDLYLSEKIELGWPENHWYQIDYQNKNYIILIDYSGGFHCCYSWRPMIVDQDSFKIGERIAIGNIGFPYSFIKDNQVYLLGTDDRFAYFKTSYVDSENMFFPVFYKFDQVSGNLIKVNNEFKSYYKEMEIKMDEVIKGMRRDYEAIYKNNARGVWLSPLIYRLSLGFLAGDQPKDIFIKFKDDYKYFDKNESEEEIKDIWIEAIGTLLMDEVDYDQAEFKKVMDYWTDV